MVFLGQAVNCSRVPIIENRCQVVKQYDRMPFFWPVSRYTKEVPFTSTVLVTAST